MSRIDIGNNIRNPKTVPATVEGFYEKADSEQTGNICAQLADALEQYQRGELSKEDYKTMKTKLKLGDSFYTPHAHFLKGYKSNEGEPFDSGKAIIDLDGCGNFEQLYTEHLNGRERKLGINMVNWSVSKTGGHVLFDIPEGLTRQEAQVWMAQMLGGVDYDAAVHEKERAIYIPCREYILYIDEELMFSDELHPAKLSSEEIAALKEAKSEASQPAIHEQQTLTAEEPSDRALAVFDETLHVMTGLTLQQANQEGVRHNTLKMLLPTLCQMMKQEELLGVLAQRMPDYAKDKDCMDLVHDFYSKYVDQNRPLNQRQQEVFLRSLKSMGQKADMEDGKEENPVFRIELNSLPIGLKESLKGNPPSLYLPLIVGEMPLLMAMASDVSVKYCDGRIQYLGGMAIIKAEQASNKSAIEHAVDYWIAPIRKEDSLAREKEETVARKNRGRKSNERAEAEPTEIIREVPITISCSRLLKRLKLAQGKTLYSFCSEMDTLIKTNSGGNWSQKFDIYRVSFDRSRWGQDYNSDQAESGIVNVAYNWTILSTPGSLKKCFRGDNVENGLSGRMMLAELPDDPYAEMTVFSELKDCEQKRIEQAVAILRSASGFYDTPRLRKAIGEWVEKIRKEAALADNRAKAVYRKRAAVIGFRCGVVFMLLAGRESKACIDFALMMADYTLYMQTKNFGSTLMQQYVKGSQSAEMLSVNRIIYDELPQTFVMQDLKAMKGADYSDGALYSIIHRWAKEGWIEKTGKTYKKLIRGK